MSRRALTKTGDIAMLFKLRLAMLVVLSSVLGYYMGAAKTDWFSLLALITGGLLLTGGSNGMNQAWEREWDRLMHRTMARPIPGGRMSVKEAVVLSALAAILGVAILWVTLGAPAGILGLAAFLAYVLVYTPMKRVSSLAVLIGAFPGAIPPLLGYLAATHDYSLEGGLLFAVQFFWQFPHFWAIAWVADEDYRRGGYRLLPYPEGRSRRSAFQIMVYSLFLIPVSLLPWVLPLQHPMVGNWAAGAALLCGLAMVVSAWKLYRSLEVSDARRLMFASFLYLPLVQVGYVLDKL